MKCRTQPATLAEIAVRTGFYKSTILRLLGSLISRGYVTRLPNGTYDLGPDGLSSWCGLYPEKTRSVTTYCLRFRNWSTAEPKSASFHVRQDAQNRICLFRVNSRHATLDRVEAGHSYALLRGAAGHIILAYAGSTGPRYEAIRASGFDVSLGERDPSCAAVAARSSVRAIRSWE